MFFFDKILFKMIIYRVLDLSHKFCHSMKMKTTSIWVDLTNDAQKIEVAVLTFCTWIKRKRFNGFSTKCYEVKKPSKRSGAVFSFLSNKESPAINHLFVKIHVIWLKTCSNPFFLVKNDQTKNTWKLTKQHQLFWPITCFKFVFW